MNRRRIGSLFWVLIPVILVSVMWLSVRSPVPEPDPATAEAIEAAAGHWWQPGGPTWTIPEMDWPPELRRLRPKTVRVASEGVFIPFGSFYVDEWGLFVLPVGSTFRPQHGSDPSFRLVRGRVYQYEIKG